MKKLLCSILIITSSLTFISCNTKKDDEKPKDDTQIENSENLEDDKADIDDNSETDKDDKNEDTSNENSEVTEPISPPNSNNGDNNSSNSSSNENEKPKEDEKPDTTVRTFKISTLDVVANNAIVYDEDLVTTGLGVAENLKLILERVSNKYFDGNEIILETIETVGDTKIAVVDLTGSNEYWHQRFNGSAGASNTEHTLIENVLQKEYPGYWINGVRFTLNGSAISDTGHIPKLVTTTYR